MATKPKTPTTAERNCRCGCAQTVSQKSNYRPGHDARHVSELVQRHATDPRPVWDNAAAGLPTDALRTKFYAAIERRAASAQIPEEVSE